MRWETIPNCPTAKSRVNFSRTDQRLRETGGQRGHDRFHGGAPTTSAKGRKPTCLTHPTSSTLPPRVPMRFAQGRDAQRRGRRASARPLMFVAAF